MKRFGITHSPASLLVGLAIVSLVAAGGAKDLGFSWAATSYNHNPVGGADSCALSGSTTILYGWAHDPDAPAGAQPYLNIVVGGTTTKVASSAAGYRDAAVNTYLNSADPGAPHSTIYGWSLAISGLYKGNSYTVSGTLLNYGTGANAALPINKDHYVDGNKAKSYFTPSSTIPDVCLAAKPVPPAPAPAPTPAPKPIAVAPKTPTKTTTPVVVAPVLSSAADATVSTGTSSAAITVPAGNASVVRILFSTSGMPQTTSDPKGVAGTTAAVTLTDLKPDAAYDYQIIRSDSGGNTTTSPAAHFKTHGYTISLTFKDGGGKPVSGIDATLNDTAGSHSTSGKDGKVAFIGLSAGGYTVKYTYRGGTYSHGFDTSADKSAQINTKGVPATITLSDAINVDQLVADGSQPASSGGHAGLVAMILGLALLASAVWFVLRRRKRQKLLAEYAALSMPAPAPVVAVDAVPTGKHDKKLHVGNVEPLPPHAGQSLSNMVLESMHAQTAQQAPAPLEPILIVPLPPLPPQPHAPPTIHHVKSESGPFSTDLPSGTVAKSLAPAVAEEPVKPAKPHKSAKSAKSHKSDDGQTLVISHDK